MTDFIATLTASDYGLSYGRLSVRPDRTFLGILMAPPQLSASVSISSITVLSPTLLRVRFSVPVVDTPALSAIVNYAISPALTIYSVTPEAVVKPNYVDLVVDEQETGVAYTLTMYTGEAAP